jgi:O-antigen/teichoic acid export membrane protein
MNAELVRFSRQTLIGGVSTGLVYLRGLLVMPILTRCFGPGDFGVWIQVFVGVELLAGLAGLGLNFALLRFVPAHEDPTQSTADIWSVLLLCAIVSLGVMGIGSLADTWLAETFLGGAEQAPLIRVALLLIPVSCSLTLVLSYLRATRVAATYAWLVACETFGWLLVALGLLITEGDLISMALGLLVVRCIILAVAVGHVLLGGRVRPPSLAVLGPYLRYGLPLLPLGLLNWIINASDRYFLAYFCESEVVGIYAVSYGIGSVIGLAYAPVFFVLLPATTAAWSAGRHGEVTEYLRFAQKYPFLLAVPCVLLLTGYAEEAIELLSTSSFSATPLLIGCVASAIAIMNIGAIAQTVLSLDCRSGRILSISLGSAAFNIATNALAIPRYGATGAAITTLITYALQVAATHVLSRSVLPFPWQWRLMLKALLSAAPLALCLLFPSETIVLRLLLVAAGCAAYVGLLFAVGAFESREWRLAMAVIRPNKPQG